jgi:hypothetical protein
MTTYQYDVHLNDSETLYLDSLLNFAEKYLYASPEERISIPEGNLHQEAIDRLRKRLHASFKNAVMTSTSSACK